MRKRSDVPPTDAFAWSRKGEILNRLQRYEEALVALEQTILLEPKWAKVHYNRGCAFEYLGRLEEAQQAYDKAKELGFSVG